MYRKYTAEELCKHLGISGNLKVDCVLVCGTYSESPYAQLESTFRHNGYAFEYQTLGSHNFLRSIRSITVGGKSLWFFTAYGGALLCEQLHLACLLGSKKNVLIGSCGGLKKGAANIDIIIPEWSYAEESSAKAYQPEVANIYRPNTALCNRMQEALSHKHKVLVGPTVTHQAMMAETWEMIQRWSSEGYIGVEMEAATVFAVSNHFDVPSAAVLRIADNLIEEETVLNRDYATSRDQLQLAAQDIWNTALIALLTDGIE